MVKVSGRLPIRFAGLCKSYVNNNRTARQVKNCGLFLVLCVLSFACLRAQIERGLERVKKPVVIVINPLIMAHIKTKPKSKEFIYEAK